MDNQKSYLPRMRENAKALVGSERLASKITGVLIYSGYYREQRKNLVYVNHDQFEQGINL